MAKSTSKSYTCRVNTVSETINGIDHEFEVNHEAAAYQDIKISVSENGKMAVVSYITRDDHAESPREMDEQDFNHMICFHRNYKLGDEHNYRDSEAFIEDLCCQAVGSDKWESIIERLENHIEKLACPKTQQERNEYYREIDTMKEKIYDKILDKHYVMLPLYLYDHGGITMSVGNFSCPWDSGQVGYIYMTRETILDNWGGKILTKAIKQKAVDSMTATVTEYDSYLTGDVYGVCHEIFVNVGTDEEPAWESYDEESCWGFYGSEYAEQEMVGEHDNYYLRRIETLSQEMKEAA